MFDIHTLLINAWRIASYPVRQANMRRAIRNQSVPLGILFYHRISNEFPNKWTISEQVFEKQIDWLVKNFELLSLAELQSRMRQGINQRPALSLTFDDGYADNCNWALPMLISRNIPVTYFVTTDHLVNDRPFQHDIDVGQKLRPLSIESVRSLASAGVEIGAHTRSHVNLGSISDEEILFDEVITATFELEKLIDRFSTILMRARN